ncbi:unnamed protein product [Caenorhabditis nigoni]
MVSYSIPMGHESLRTILLHTDPNLRFKVAQRIPKIRLTEKAVPLRIKSLSLIEFTTKVNSTSYKLGVYFHYHTADIPMVIKDINKTGGLNCDVDQYGFEIPNSFDPILNGDVSFRRGYENDEMMDTEEVEQSDQLSLRIQESALAKINELESEGKTVEEFLAGPMTRDDRRLRHYMGLSKEKLQEAINQTRTNLLPFHYRRKNLSPPYTCYIQLTITQGKVETIQRYQYNHKLYEAAKKFNEIFFANRHVIIVNQFQISSIGDVWRIPVGFKISANFVYGDISQIDPISLILDPTRTLTELSIQFVEELDSNFQHSFVKNAETLSIFAHREMIDPLMRAFETMGNQHIHIVFFRFVNLTANEYFHLMQGWLSTERNVGSMITFRLKNKKIGRQILNLVRTQNEGTESTDGCVTVLRSNATKLEVSNVPFSGRKFFHFLLTVKIMKA